MKTIFKKLSDNKFYIFIGIITIAIILIIINSATSKAPGRITQIGADVNSTNVNTLSPEEVIMQRGLMSISGEWIWTKTTYDKSGWAPSVPAKVGDFVLSLNTSMSATLKTDCNDVSAKYSITPSTSNATSTENAEFASAGQISVSDISSTKKFCQGSKEVAFVNDFKKVSSYDVGLNTLTLKIPEVGKISFTRSNVTDGQ